MSQALPLQNDQAIPTLVFPWLGNLPPNERTQFYRELFPALQQAWRSGDWHPVEELLDSWEATAEVLADAELTAFLTEPAEAGAWEPWDDVEAALFDPA